MVLKCFWRNPVTATSYKLSFNIFVPCQTAAAFCSFLTLSPPNNLPFYPFLGSQCYFLTELLYRILSRKILTYPTKVLNSFSEKLKLPQTNPQQKMGLEILSSSYGEEVTIVLDFCFHSS